MKRIFALVLLGACGGSPFSSTDFAPQADGGANVEAAVQFDQTADQVVDHRTASPEAAADAGTDVVAVDPDAGMAPDGTTMGEDAAVDAGADVAPSEDADAGCALVTHDNGLGQTWQDCTPTGTHTQDQAMQACTAYCATNACTCGQSNLCGSDPGVTAQIGIGSPIVAIIWSTQGGNVVDVRNGNPSFTCTVAGTWN